MKKNDIPPAFMAKSPHCAKEGGLGVIGGVTVIDTSVCHWCCSEDCREYADFHEGQVNERKRLTRLRRVPVVEGRPELEL